MQLHTQTTTDTGFAAHLIKRRFQLTEMDRSEERDSFTFQMTAAQFEHERDWYDIQNMGNFIHIYRALAGATRGREVHAKALEKWPCLAVANEEAGARAEGGQS